MSCYLKCDRCKRYIETPKLFDARKIAIVDATGYNLAKIYDFCDGCTRDFKSWVETTG